MRHVPNTLSVLRCLAVLVLAVLMLDPGTRLAALLVFVAAAVTDWFDGYLARRFDVVSDFGRMLDPIADKLLVAVALLMVAADGTIAGVHVLAAALILMREFAISGLREHLAPQGIIVPASLAGKAKAMAQMVALALLIAAPLVPVPGVAAVGLAVLWIAAALTVLSGAQYAWGARRSF